MTDPMIKQFDNVPILIIDDSELNSSVISMQLKPYGLDPIKVPKAHDGFQLIQQLKGSEKSIPLIICDFHMADMNGMGLLRLLRNEPTTEDIKVIFLASYGLGDLTRELASLGVKHILKRPCSTYSLIEAVSDCLKTTAPSPRKYKDKSEIRILAADDDPINLAVLKGFLNLAGYSVDTVSDGVDAVKASENIHYDLILMDICMPTMDGVIATLQIRTNEKRGNRPPVPIVAVTAHFSPSQRDRYLEAGMNDVMAKPIRKDIIDACLQEWCVRYPETHNDNETQVIAAAN